MNQILYANNIKKMKKTFYVLYVQCYFHVGKKVPCGLMFLVF